MDGCTHRLCLESLTGNQSLSDIGSLQVNLYAQDGWELKVFNGTAKCFLNNRIVKISGGRKSAEQLCEELAAALGQFSLPHARVQCFVLISRTAKTLSLPVLSIFR
ncbi:hypothetical protein [Dysosmobacter sp.]|uniref:hypothetical protein n=1 Tax=Dysosmobacter sp. TaxID=2591382 RepID=UPI002A87D710|nr:hypothetical protein [Dysosmobacter sp.]MDY3984427.1 hypothetical protein [Dysosmobacter sp.]